MKNFVKGGVFIIIVGFLVHYLNVLYTPKEVWGKAPYYEQENSIDVVFIGSSHVEWGIDPNILWVDYGISAINYAIQSLDLKNSYFLFRELLKYQKPKVVIFDVYQIHDAYSHLGLTNRLSKSINLSLNRFQMINENDSLTFSQKMDYYFPLNLYHTRSLDSEDFVYKYSNPERGHYVQFENLKEEYIWKEDYMEEADLSQQYRVYVQRIIDYANENNVKIMFIKVPHLNAEVNLKKTWNSIERIANENNIPFINFNRKELFTEVGLVYTKDIANDSESNGHLNHYGASKLTLYLGEVLKEKFELKDKRGNTRYGHLDILVDLFKEKYYTTLASKRWVIAPETILKAGEMIISEKGRYRFIFQYDGNLVLYDKDKKPLWASNTVGAPATKLVMQGDGNLVLYDDHYTPYWSTGTYGNYGAWFELGRGDMVVRKDEEVLWEVKTGNNKAL